MNKRWQGPYGEDPPGWGDSWKGRISETNEVNQTDQI